MITTFSITQFRQYFPATQQQNKTIFLDSAATVNYYQHINTSVDRGQHSTARTTTDIYEQTRKKVVELINANQAEEVIWTKGSIESINFITQGYFRAHLQPNDEIIVSEIEHHTNLIPWLIVAEQTGAKVVKWPLDELKQLSIKHLTTFINTKTRIIAISPMSNVTVKQPNIQAITWLAHQHNILVAVDGAQGIIHRGIDVQAL
ncbi:aminotransferase class V-fold PLP-dependent enzyme [Arsenophonus endosymbiont of Aleurodicus floccissimus]|uniref:aminotransferase class V-fold PLP-dependent enzyme n=1 Tax=Arsenophonus endosymbiont of Aleurodicus floccissimus TaxID=2152761 RepID=UPI000E6B143D|nr:aminotransferase class V-fold PLP-dependent enzyme [Arsenophonus endosymbiont of Aleurodicus floccissimus]